MENKKCLKPPTRTFCFFGLYIISFAHQIVPFAGNIPFGKGITFWRVISQVEVGQPTSLSQVPETKFLLVTQILQIMCWLNHTKSLFSPLKVQCAGTG